MSKNIEDTLKLALEALEKIVDGWTKAFAEYKYDSDIPSENQFRDEVFAAITAIKEALMSLQDGAQPEQEPVACVVPHGATMRLEWASVDAAHNAKIGPLYTTPPQRKPLTDEMVTAAARVLNERQADACGVDRDDQWAIYSDDFKADARAMLEAAHGIKE
jgi:hypothetical protein